MSLGSVWFRRHEGRAALNSWEAILKGLLESDTPIDVAAGPRLDIFAPLLAVGRDPDLADLLRSHDLELRSTPDERQAALAALRTAAAGRAGVALIGGNGVTRVLDALERWGRPFAKTGAAVLICEDAPLRGGERPRDRFARLGAPILEPADLGELRDMIALAVRFSRVAGRPSALVVHRTIWDASDTIELQPNREPPPHERVLLDRARRRRPRRASESGGLLRFVRRLELNESRAIPNPGERAPVGFVTVGAADAAFRHVLHVARLSGRAPTLRLRVLEPLDAAALGRLLTRADHIVVLEPRPGEVHAMVLAAAEDLRRAGERPGLIWGPTLPPDGEAPSRVMAPDDAAHPSRLRLAIAHLLNWIRPGACATPASTPARDAASGPRFESAGVMRGQELLRRQLVDLDQWLHEGASEELEASLPPSALALDGVRPDPAPARTVDAIVWSRLAALREGPGAVRAALRQGRPTIALVADLGGVDDRGDVERVLRAAAPADRTKAIDIVTLQFSDRVALRERLRQAATADMVTVIVVRDDDPPRFDDAAADREAEEIDRLGYQPSERLIRRADAACAIDAPADVAAGAPIGQETRLESSWHVDRLPRRMRGRVQLRARPLLEQIEVRRTRPPRTREWESVIGSLSAPQPVAGRQAEWRCHLAGLRGGAPGALALVLQEAGREMGYHVRLHRDARRIGPRRWAGAELIFTRPRPDEPPSPLVGQCPWGEADLLLALSPRAAQYACQVRGVASRSRTSLIFDDSDRVARTPEESEGGLPVDVAALTREDQRLAAPFGEACLAQFSTVRLADFAALGAAFQRGFIPTGIDALERGLERIESAGTARALEAFRFGRGLADRTTAALLAPKSVDAGGVRRDLRRATLAVRWRRPRMRRFLARTMERMPGLTETDSGRHAARELVSMLWRAVQWGGFDLAESLADQVVHLYDADRGDRSRALVRHAILPLAESHLIRDFPYVARMAMSFESQRRLRARFHLKPGPGDEIERRFLTRFEAYAFGRRVRFDLRSSSWLMWLGAAGAVWPNRWRGTKNERGVRTYVRDVVQRAIEGAAADYDRWEGVMRRLHAEAEATRFRGATPMELRLLIEPWTAVEANESEDATTANAPEGD